MISVIIPAYNEQERIGDCLRVLTRQTVPRSEYEIIVVDGGSKDRTREIAGEYADLVFIQKSERVGGARNDGICRAKYDIVVTTDADSIADERWIEETLKGFSDPAVVLAFGPIRPVSNTPRNRRYTLLFNTLTWFGAVTRFYYYTLGCNTAFRKDAFMRAGMYHTVDAGDDLEIAVRMRRMGRVAFNPSMRVGFDFRRYEEFGFFRTLFEWYMIVLQGGVSDRYTYTRKNYTNGAKPLPTQTLQKDMPPIHHGQEPAPCACLQDE